MNRRWCWSCRQRGWRPFNRLYDALQGQVKLLLTTYFEGVSDNLATIAALLVQGLHVDLVHGKDDVAELHNRLLKPTGCCPRA